MKTPEKDQGNVKGADLKDFETKLDMLLKGQRDKLDIIIDAQMHKAKEQWLHEALTKNSIEEVEEMDFHIEIVPELKINGKVVEVTINTRRL
jgi:hypothetical protein